MGRKHHSSTAFLSSPCSPQHQVSKQALLPIGFPQTAAPLESLPYCLSLKTSPFSEVNHWLPERLPKAFHCIHHSNVVHVSILLNMLLFFNLKTNTCWKIHLVTLKHRKLKDNSFPSPAQSRAHRPQASLGYPEDPREQLTQRSLLGGGWAQGWESVCFFPRRQKFTFLHEISRILYRLIIFKRKLMIFKLVFKSIPILINWF